MDLGKRYYLTSDRVWAECVPMLLAYYALVILGVILPNTRLLRAAFTPVVLGLFGNAILHWDVSGGDPDKYYMNNPSTVCISLFAVPWASYLTEGLVYSRAPLYGRGDMGTQGHTLCSYGRASRNGSKCTR